MCLPVGSYNQDISALVDSVEDLSIRGISKERQNEISSLVVLLRAKQAKLNKLKQGEGATSSVKLQLKRLLEKYGVDTNNHECDAGAGVLFGLTDICSNSPEICDERLTRIDDAYTSFDPASKRLPSGNFSAPNFPPKHLLMKIQMLKLKLSLYKENCATAECVKQCREHAERFAHLVLLRQKTTVKAVDTYKRALSFLVIEAKLLKYRILKEYYSEDEGVVKASLKLKDVIETRVKTLETKEEDLKIKIQCFKKLEGTKYDLLVRDYQAVLKSIIEKEWTLENMV